MNQDPHLDDEALAAFLDGGLEGEARQRAESHLLECDDCRGVLAATHRNAVPASLRRRTPWMIAGGLVAAAAAFALFLLPGIIAEAPGGRPGFYFLDPIARERKYSGTFDPSVSPTVEVCIWNGAVCRTGERYTMAGAPGTERVQVFAEGERFAVNWHASNTYGAHPLQDGERYRIRVLVGFDLLGFADVAAEDSGRRFRNVATNRSIPLVDGRTLPISFRIERGAVDSVCAAGKPSGVISWWRAEGDAADAVGTHSGVLRGRVAFGEGRCGQAFQFDERGELVEVPHDTSLDLESKPSATVEGWFKSFGGLENIPEQIVIISTHTCGDSSGWFFTTRAGAFIGNHHVGENGLVEKNLHDSLFHHFAVVKDGTRYFEYVDGVMEASDSGPEVGRRAVGNPPLQMGAATSGVCAPVFHQLNGFIDEMAIYNRALSSGEITALAQPRPTGKTPDR